MAGPGWIAVKGAAAGALVGGTGTFAGLYIVALVHHTGWLRSAPSTFAIAQLLASVLLCSAAGSVIAIAVRGSQTPT